MLVLRFAIVFALSFVLMSCTSVNSKVGGVLGMATDVKLEFSVLDNANPDEQKQASPVFVRLYELSDRDAFDQADFIGLYERDKAMLGKEFVVKKELKRFVPGEVRNERFVLSEGTRFVGLYAEFFQYEDAKYKVVFPVTENNFIRNTVSVVIDGNRILLQAD